MKAEDRRKLWQEAADDMYPILKDSELFSKETYMKWLEEKVQELRGNK